MAEENQRMTKDNASIGSTQVTICNSVCPCVDQVKTTHILATAAGAELFRILRIGRRWRKPRLLTFLYLDQLACLH